MQGFPPHSTEREISLNSVTKDQYAVESQSIGVVRVTRQVLSTIVINTALQIPGVVRIAQASDQWSRLLGREMLRQGVKLTGQG